MVPFVGDPRRALATDAVDAVAGCLRTARGRGHARRSGRPVVAGGRGARLGPPRSPCWRRWPKTPWPQRPRPCARGSPLCSWWEGTRSGGGASTAADRVARATGAKLLCETFPARIERGAGIPPVERLGYLAEFTIAQLQGARHLVLADALAPVSFFAYPNLPGYLVPEGCEVHILATGSEDAPGALETLAEVLGAPPSARRGRSRVASRTGPPARCDPQSLAAAIGALLPEGAVVSDEGNTSGLFVSGATAGAPRHDWLCLTGGAIGQGLPLATGAAVACPDRPVLCLEADGSAMYTLPVAVDPGARRPGRDHGRPQ